MGSSDQHHHSYWIASLKALAVSQHFSQATWYAIRCYLESGAISQRGHRLVEFFKTLDWLPLSEIDKKPLKQFSPRDIKRLEQEIQAYLIEKASKRQTDREKRESYRLRVFEYFRAHVSTADKQLLERLRDFELERIGQDVNWRHYFWFTSFKQIDAFVSQSPTQRMNMIAQFKQDVLQHEKNAERLRNGTYGEYYWGHEGASAPETFEEWLNRQAQAESNPHRQGQSWQSHGQRQTTATRPLTGLERAYQLLKVSPKATVAEIRQQFRQLVRQYHPDVPGGDAERMKEILAAYDKVMAVSRSSRQHS